MTKDEVMKLHYDALKNACFVGHAASEAARISQALSDALDELYIRLSGQTCFVPPEFLAEMDELRAKLEEAEAKLDGAMEQWLQVCVK